MSEASLPAGSRRLNLAGNHHTDQTTILFLHGVTRNWRTFHNLLTGLHGEFGLSALDFRGHGNSDRAPGAYSVVDYVDDALAVLRKAEAPVVIYGHSLGAMVA